MRCKKFGVVGFDLAGGEAGRPARLHGEAFDIALAGNLGITVHAGEAAGAESVAEAIRRCHAVRIGHGTRIFEDPELQDFIRDRQIVVETNITSNLQTHAVTEASEHPVRRYFDAGLAVTLCTDSWLMSGVHLSDEYWLAHRSLGFTQEEIHRMILNAFAAAFLPWPERQALLASVHERAGGHVTAFLQARRWVLAVGLLMVGVGAAWFIPGATGRGIGRLAAQQAATQDSARLAPAPATPVIVLQPPPPPPTPITTRLVGLIGMALIIAIGYAMSNNRKAIRWQTVAWGLSLQILFAIFVLRVPFGRELFRALGSFVTSVLHFSYVGSGVRLR